MYKRKFSSLDDYERRIRLLRDEFSYLSTEKSMLHQRYANVSNRVYMVNTVCDLLMFWLVSG